MSELVKLRPIAQIGVARRLFCLEAADRAGKTTLAANLAAYLPVHHGLQVRVFREPGGSSRAEEIRRILKNPDSGLSPEQETELFYEARGDLLKTTLLPWLSAGRQRVAILDRYFWSTLVYQGLRDGYNLDRLVELTVRICAEALPERTYFLDIDPLVADARVMALGGDADVDRNDLADIADKRRLRDGYHALTELFPDLIRRIDAALERDELTRLVGEDIAGLVRSAE